MYSFQEWRSFEHGVCPNILIKRSPAAFWPALGKTWNGMEWNGLEWNGMEWFGMEWNGMDWNGMEFYQEHFLFISNLPPLNPIVPLTLTPRPPTMTPSLDPPDLDPHLTLTNNLDPSSALDPGP